MEAFADAQASNTASVLLTMGLIKKRSKVFGRCMSDLT